MKYLYLLPCILFSGVAATAAPSSHSYEIDPVHSGVNFKVRHFFNNVPGKFTDFQGTIDFNPSDPSLSQVHATISPTSVDTSNDKRDAHLLEEDYFHTSEHETIDFKSTQWVPDGKSADGHAKYEVTGDLTLLGKTKPVTLEVIYLGEMEGKGPYEGVMVAGWEASGKIDRTEWGLSGGQPIVGNDVEIELSIQGHRPIAEPKTTGGAGGK